MNWLDKPVTIHRGWFSLFLFVPIATTVLTACEAKLNVTREPNKPTRIEVPDGAGTGSFLISEICYDNVVCLVTDRGGISPKMDPNSPNNATRCPQ